MRLRPEAHAVLSLHEPPAISYLADGAPVVQLRPRWVWSDNEARAEQDAALYARARSRHVSLPDAESRAVSASHWLLRTKMSACAFTTPSGSVVV